MLVVQGKLVQEDIVKEEFKCNLSACKGACCWEGDFGAPLEPAELHTLEAIYDKVKPYLTQEGKAAIEQEGLFVYYKENKEYGTPLVNGGACAYMTYDELGIARCGIEWAHRDGIIDFKKPVSCHLYPIRINENHQQGFDQLVYDRWDICSAACQKGKKEKVKVYEFAKEAIIRKYGEAFYEELAATAEFVNQSSEK